MKKYLFAFILLIVSFVLPYCSSSKKINATAATVVKTTYAEDVSTVIMNNCVPCHIPSKGGNKTAYDNFGNVKTDIDEILRRIQLKPGEKGFMPMKKTEPLSDSIIAVFKTWKANGLLEK